jgi:valyl-tRNA synthetase
MAIYHFTWGDFCDWYIEAIKPRLQDKTHDPAQRQATWHFAIDMMERIARLLHPFMPFITEEIYQRIGQIEGHGEGRTASIAHAPYPDADRVKYDAEAVREFGYLQELVSAIRNVRGELTVPPAKEAQLAILKDDPHLELVKREWVTVAKLARLAGDGPMQVDAKPEHSAASVVAGREVFVPLKGLIDLEAERARVSKEIGKLEGLIKGTEKKLSNEKFVANAPEDVVAREREKLEDFSAKLEKLRQHLEQL